MTENHLGSTFFPKEKSVFFLLFIQITLYPTALTKNDDKNSLRINENLDFLVFFFFCLQKY